jgi:hypothetical protein
MHRRLRRSDPQLDAGRSASRGADRAREEARSISIANTRFNLCIEVIAGVASAEPHG